MKFEDLPNPLETQMIGFQSSTSFDELYELLQIQGDVKGAQKDFSASELIKKIEQVRHGHRDTGFITRSYGLRDIVEKLLTNDKVYKKYKKNNYIV